MVTGDFYKIKIKKQAQKMKSFTFVFLTIKVLFLLVVLNELLLWAINVLSRFVSKP